MSFFVSFRHLFLGMGIKESFFETLNDERKVFLWRKVKSRKILKGWSMKEIEFYVFLEKKSCNKKKRIQDKTV